MDTDGNGGNERKENAIKVLSVSESEAGWNGVILEEAIKLMTGEQKD